MVIMKFRNLYGPFDQRELTELSIATLSLTIAFYNFFNFKGAGNFLLILLITTFSFVPHELAHKFTAIYMKTKARFEIFILGVILAIATSFFGFIFAAPGAVRLLAREEERYGLRITELTPRQMSLISMAGPVLNIVFGLIFLALSEFYNPLILGARLNFVLAFFNLLPIPPLDGSKAILWKPILWFALFALSFILWLFA